MLFRGPFDERRCEVAAAHLRIVGATTGDALGAAVGGGGDFDADGNVDLVASATGYDEGTHSGAGAVGIFYGPLPRGVATFSAADVQIIGDASSDAGTLAVGAPTDIDGDGWDDLVFGASGSDIVAARAVNGDG